MYNYDQQVKFWATPPIHGCLAPEVVFPGDMVFKIPDNLSYAEGAMVEPLAVGMQGVTKAKIKPGQRLSNGLRTYWFGYWPCSISWRVL